MENRLFFDTPMNDHFIHFEKNNNMCWIENYYLDDSNPKTFFLLLRCSVTQLKEKGITKFQQILTYSDFDIITKKFDKSQLTIIKDDTIMQTKHIECDIEYAIDIIHLGIMESLVEEEN